MGLKRWVQAFRTARHTPRQKTSLSLTFEDMERRLNRTALSLFEEYRLELLEKPPAYLVPAVWGEKKSGDLDATQKEIHRILAPVLQGIQEEMATGEARSDSASNFGYMLRGLFLYRLAYMVQFYMNRKGLAGVPPRAHPLPLERMEPVGRA